MLNPKIIVFCLLVFAWQDTVSGYNFLNRPGKCYCGVPNRRHRIVGGNRVDEGEYPWQVKLRINWPDKTNPKGWLTGSCGGTLVGTRYVVSAAHCFVDYDKSNTQSYNNVNVILGATKFKGPQKFRRFTVPARYVLHPEYAGRRTKNANDIAVLTLKHEINLYALPHIKPACLPLSSMASFIGKSAVASGWGHLEEGAKWSPDHLQEVTLKILGKRKCGNYNDMVTKSNFCAGVLTGGKDTCQGDSGGPLVARDGKNNDAMTLVGVTSFGKGCARPGYPGVYANVPYFMANDWLKQQMPGLKTCSPPPRA